MTTYNPGDTVLVDFPFVSGNETRSRPALVLLDTGDADVVVARVTSQSRSDARDVEIADWSAAGLLLPSVARLHKLATLEKRLIVRTLGRLSPADRQSAAKVLGEIFAERRKGTLEENAAINLDRRAREDAVLNLVKTSRDVRDVLLAKVAAALHDNFPYYTGVYIYLLEGETLMLGPYRGRPTEHTRIPIGAGICGRAARAKETVVVDDVNADAEYIACSLQTRSEIVVPIMRDACVFGEIDIDSDVPAAFTAHDREFLEEVARLLAVRFV